jgi:hypothetical protein
MDETSCHFFIFVHLYFVSPLWFMWIWAILILGEQSGSIWLRRPQLDCFGFVSRVACSQVPAPARFFALCFLSRPKVPTWSSSSHALISAAGLLCPRA